jgi:hypothetical protein
MQDVQSLGTCLQTNGCYGLEDDAFYTCLGDFCMDPYFKCFSGNVYAACTDLTACLNSCPDDNAATPDVNEADECVGACFGDASYEANVDYQALLDCLFKDACTVCAVENPTPAQDEECATCQNTELSAGGKCNAQYTKCVAAGTKKCGEVMTCMNACADEACVTACVQEGTFTARDLLQKMYDCIYAACPDTSDEAKWTECANTATTGTCATDVTACQNDAAAS